jgi:pSer/pThr/pTyr-binding forkhead associated (FHA) protein
VSDSSILILRHLRPDGDVDTYHLRSGRRYVVGRGSGAQVRILDPKMSRHHAAFEVRDGVWKLGDLGSTNGVKVDGDLIAGWTATPAGTTAEIGASTFSVVSVMDPDQPEAAALVVEEAVAPASDKDTEVVVSSIEQEPAPPGSPSDRISGVFPDLHEPEPGTDRHRTSGALEPVGLDLEDDLPATPVAHHTAPLERAGRTVAPVVAEAIRPVTIAVEPAVPAVEIPPPAPAVVAVAAPAPAPAAADLNQTLVAGDATYFVTVLGARIGPVTRAQARDLKARELRGALTEADLVGLPRA